MNVVPIADELTAAQTNFDLARRLGRTCTEESGILKQYLGDEAGRKLLIWIEDHVAAIPLEFWFEAEKDGDFGRLLADEKLRGRLEDAALMSPLDRLGVLRGMLRGVISWIYETAEGEIRLDTAMPVPWAIRPMRGKLSPHPATFAKGHPLADLNFSWFRHGASEEVTVTLDYSKREQLDAVTWSNTERLPKVGLVYPTFGMDNFEVGEINDEWFFSVAPKDWDLDLDLMLLGELPDDIEIAVLPELCLPQADALAAELAAHPERYPALIVAGSAHEQAGEDRHNECRVYLYGHEVLSHHKCHAYEAGHLGELAFDPKLPEGLSPGVKELRLLCGTYTRLGVVICADLNDELVPDLLLDAGVNLLFVPSLSVGYGAFNGAISALAARRQGMSVIVNAGFEGEDGFHAVAGVPRAQPSEQTKEYIGPVTDGPSLAFFDPALPLAQAVQWLQLQDH